MMPLLVFREQVKSFYQRNDIYITPVVKFIFALVSFTAINLEIGYDARLKSIPIVLALSLLSAFTPSAVMVLLAALLAILHIYFIAPIISILVVVLLMIIYFLFARFTPRLGYVLLALPILYFIKIPYVIPLLLGIISTPVAIVPTACGIVIFYVIQIIKTAITMQANTSIEDILQLYIYVIDELKNNKPMIMSIVIFILILMVVYYVRKMKFDYAFEISIAAGALTSVLGFLISYLILGQSDQIFAMILGTIVSAAIVLAIQFFKLTLDYSGVELVQFEDDVYYYYVKAVPKITVTTPQRKVKHINVKNAVHGAVKAEQNKYDNMEDEDDEGYFQKNSSKENNSEE